MNRPRLLLLFALLSPLLVFWQRGLNEPDEGRYVEIAREMLTGGDLITPRLKGVPHYAKPPLSYWLLAGAMAVFGERELAVRVPGTLAALGLLLVAFDLGRRLGGTEERGALAALALAAMPLFLALARIVTTDMVQALLIGLAFLALVRAELEPTRRRRWSLAVFLALGLGFLNKGPVPLAVFLCGLLAVSLLRRDLSIWRRLDWRWAALVPLVGLPWFLVVVARDPDLVRFFLGGEVVDRVATGRGRSKPPWYFLIVFPLGLLAMTPLLFRSLPRLWRERDRAATLVLGFLAGPFVLFSGSASKLWTYVLPLCLPAALVLALDRRRRLAAPFLIAVTISVALVVAADLVAERRALELGNNAGYRAVAEAFAGESFRGVAIPDAIEPARRPPVFVPGPETRIATFRLRFVAAAFYFLRARAEYVPIYGGDSLWEWPERQALEHVPDQDDLRAAWRRPEPMLLLLRARDLEELRLILGEDPEIVATFGDGAGAVVACRRYPE